MQKDVFCTDKIYENVFFETKYFIVAYDKRPILPGHSLVIPKRHVLYITDLTDEETLGLRELLKLVIPKLLKVYDADSYNLSTHAGENAGMVIAHLHFHLVPRSTEDAFHGDIMEFHNVLNSERADYIKSVGSEIERLRKVFKYKPRQRKAV